jgi:L-rhamnose mutarotase
MRYCLALDLQNDAALIAEYEDWHKKVWPEIKKSIRDAGIVHMEIYRLGDRLIMILETSDDFSLEKKAAMDLNNPIVRQWETLMSKYQRPFDWAKPGEKWMAMKKVFDLDS